MLLSEMTREYQGVLACSGDAEVQGLCYDSRKVKPGDLYFCLPGVRADGHDFAAQAKEKGGKLVTLCSACHHVIKRVNLDMQNNEYIRTRVNNYIAPDAPYAGETQVLHYLELLRDELGFEQLKKSVVNPLKGRKIAAYYGCMLLRPAEEMGMDDPENPKILEDFLRALGAEPVLYPYRNECCGGYIALEDKGQARQNVDKILHSASLAGAEAVITACPLCLYNLAQNAGKERLPVLYFTELLAEALGVKEEA